MTTVKTGIYYDLGNDVYHGGDGLSKSDLDQLHRSAAHYMAAKTMRDEPTPAMIFGSAFHCLVLEPERFQREYAAAPNVDRRTKAGKEAWKELEAAGKTVLAADDYSALTQMRDSMMSNPIAFELVNNSKHEVSAYAEIDGVLCKCRPDVWSEKLGIIADLKTTLDASPKGFARAVADRRYHVQDAWYSNVWERAGGGRAREFIFIAVEKKSPYSAGIYFLHSDAKLQGWAEAMNDMKVYIEASQNNEWKAYSENPVELELPRWAQNF